MIIAAVTLTPSGGTTTSGLSGCLVCGSRGVADAILNLALFLPLGVALRLGGRSIRASLLLALVLSGTIELLQIVVPGRDPSWGDVVFNVAGALAGASLLRPFLRVAVPSESRRWPLAILAATAFVAHAGVLALLLRPAFPDEGWYGQLTPELARLETYGGRVTDARVGDIPLAIGRLPRSPALKAALLGGEPLRVEFVTGPAPSAFAPIVAAATGGGVHLFLLGADGPDLVLLVRTWAGELRLSEPEVRWHDALLDVPVGRATTAGMRAGPSGWCLTLGDRTRCGLGPTIGSGWNLLLPPESAPDGLHRIPGAVWVGLLALATAWWVADRPGPAALGLVAVGAGAWLVPLAADWLAPTPPEQWLAIGLGGVAGWALRRAHAVRHRP